MQATMLEKLNLNVNVGNNPNVEMKIHKLTKKPQEKLNNQLKSRQPPMIGKAPNDGETNTG